MLTLAFASQLAKQRKRAATDSEMPPVVLDAADFMERILVEKDFVLKPAWDIADQSGPAVIAQHFRMHARETGRSLQGKKPLRPGGHTNERKPGGFVEGEVGPKFWGDR